MSWWRDYFSCVDTLNMDNVGKWFAKDMDLQFANTPIKGRDAAVAAIAGFASQLSSIKHTLGDVIEQGDKVFADAVVTYTMRDGRAFDIPAGTYMQKTGAEISVLRIYVDLAPLFAK